MLLEILASRRLKQIVQRLAPGKRILERQRQPEIHPRREMRQAQENFTPLQRRIWIGRYSVVVFLPPEN
jgi:hypothetical protein